MLLQKSTAGDYRISVVKMGCSDTFQNAVHVPTFQESLLLNPVHSTLEAYYTKNRNVTVKSVDAARNGNENRGRPLVFKLEIRN